jgi:DNA-binding CsgD family transcriptional regulator
MQLFCHRLSSADPDFTLTPENASIVVELCREVDGLPLALELAAARCATLGVATMLDLYRQDPVAVLGPAPGPGGKGHRSLRATIQWSYSLLAPSQKFLFRELGVFAGPFSWSAVVAVTRDGHRSPREPGAAAQLADELSTLVTAGLVRRVKSDDPLHAGRYVLPAAVRAFAWERAAAGGQLDELRRRHGDHYRDLARNAAARQWTFGAGDDGGELLADKRELLAALEVVEDGHCLADTLSFVVDLEQLWMGIGAASGAERLRALLACTEDVDGDAQESAEVPDELAAAALVSLVTLTVWSRDPTLGETLHTQLSRGSRLARRAQRPDIELRAMQIEIQLLIFEQDPDGASDIALKAQEIAAELGADWWQMRFLHWSAIATHAAGDYTGALHNALAARDLARAADDEHQLLWTTHVVRGITGAADDARWGLPSDQGLLDLARRLGDVRAEGMILLTAAFRSALRGRVGQAATYVADALELTGRTGYWYIEELSLFVLVLITVHVGEAENAAELHGALSRALPSIQSWLPRPAIATYDAAISSARASLGEEQFEQLAADGELLGWDAALRRAVGLASTLAARDQGTASDERADLTASSRWASSAPGELSSRELEVLWHMAAGCANKDIAVALGVRPKTVMHHAASIYRKLGVHSRTQAINAALRLRLLDHSPGGSRRLE